ALHPRQPVHVALVERAVPHEEAVALGLVHRSEILEHAFVAEAREPGRTELAHVGLGTRREGGLNFFETCGPRELFDFHVHAWILFFEFGDDGCHHGHVPELPEVDRSAWRARFFSTGGYRQQTETDHRPPGARV